MFENLVTQPGGMVCAAASADGAVFEMPPHHAEPDATAVSALNAREPDGGHRILLIDDDPDIAGIVGEVLEELGQTVQVAHSGPEGLELARRFHPDTVFCDIGLPGMSGYDIAQAIRQDPQLQSVFLVAVTGYVQPDDILRAKSAGFDRHLAKPSRIDDIERLLAEMPPNRLAA